MKQAIPALAAHGCVERQGEKTAAHQHGGVGDKIQVFVPSKTERGIITCSADK